MTEDEHTRIMHESEQKYFARRVYLISKFILVEGDIDFVDLHPFWVAKWFDAIAEEFNLDRVYKHQFSAMILNKDSQGYTCYEIGMILWKWSHLIKA